MRFRNKKTGQIYHAYRVNPNTMKVVVNLWEQFWDYDTFCEEFEEVRDENRPELDRQGGEAGSLEDR